MKLRVAIAIIIFAVALFVCSCDNATATSEGDTTPNSPSECLSIMSSAISDGNVKLYGAMLHPEFEFHFAESDVGKVVGENNFIIPDKWGKIDELEAIGNMISKSYSVAITFDSDNFEIADATAETYTANEVPISFILMTSDTDGTIMNTTGTFHFKKEMVNGKAIWKLLVWYDGTTTSGNSTISC